ncbi:amp-dependent synthetase ligase [Colletotrichum truncatum]|uniref:Amp-dependent synthetase ligase n=1 Tax=Colletotrichum truncatum TaxID=5467 RepID=A0ACC3ZIL3_COLTU|nr:amp-dependent synthetase ligase [Colletotrichum truncatum]KAF6791770.1 amp-dependent synthetase ligase [Colletotrichum truncatum]
MGFFDNIMLQLDEAVSGFFGQWNTYTTALVTLLVIIVSYRIFSSQDPDTHPMLLARQAQGSPVRQKGESPVYRSHSSPHGMPLNSGLNVKDPGASKWSRGRDGDLRDIWRRAATGGSGDDGKPAGAKGRLLTVLGSENVVEHQLDDVTRQINLIGQHIHEQGGIRVAIYLPNSIELLVALFACSFYPNLTAILIPFDVSDEELIMMLRRSAADTLVTAPGAFPFDPVVKAYPSLRQLIWVVDEGSSHMDWNEVPEGTGGSVNVATWQDIVHEAPASIGRELPAVDKEVEPREIITFWQTKPGTLEEMVRFTQSNLVSGVAGQLAAIPSTQRLGPSDLFLAADSLTNIHTLTLTLAALYSNASVAFNSVAGRSPDLVLATQGVAPTVLVATPETLLRTHKEATNRLTSAIAKVAHWAQSRSLTDSGVMPVASAAAKFNSASRPAIGTTPGKLRLVYVADRAGADSPPLSSRVLSDLRVFLGARIIYALTAPKVAGAVAQTGFYDYRVQDDAQSHFGPPVTSTEILLRDTEKNKNADQDYQGEIFVRGPSVAGSETSIKVAGRIRDDNTLAYA